MLDLLIFAHSYPKNLMKKILFITTTLFLFSCKKEKICNCGTIIWDYGNTTAIYPYQTIVVKNDCSGNERHFDIIPTSVYELIFIGEKYCVINIYNW
jgi:hypothetical protein